MIEPNQVIQRTKNEKIKARNNREFAEQKLYDASIDD